MKNVCDKFRDKFYATGGQNVEALDERERVGPGLELAGEGRAGARNELVGKDENEKIGIRRRLNQVGDSDDVLGQRSARQVLDIFVVLIDDLTQFPPVDLLLKDP